MSNDINQKIKLPTSKRWYAVTCACAANLIVWLDETCFGILTPFWSEAFNLSPVEIASISSAYLLGYFPLLLIAGILADKLGAKKMLLIAVVGCAILSAAILLCTDTTTMYWRNFFFGIFFGFNWAPCNKLISDWTPPRERSTAVGYWSAVSTFSGMIGAPLALMVASYFNWRAAFLLVTALSVPVFIMLLRVKDNPADAKGISPEELEYITSDRNLEAERAGKIDFRAFKSIFKDWRVWMMLGVSMLATGPTWISASWGTMVLMNGMNFTAGEAAAIIPPLMLFSIAASIVSPFLLRAFRGNLRLLIAMGPLLGGSGFILVALFQFPPVIGAILVLGLGYCSNPWGWGGLNSYWAAYFKDRPEVLGTINGAGAAVQVAFGYCLIRVSGSLIHEGATLGGYGQLFLVGGIIWFVCFIFLALSKNINIDVKK